MNVRKITIEFENGVKRTYSPAEWLGLLMGSVMPAEETITEPSESDESSASLLSDNTTNSTSVAVQESFQSARNLVSAAVEEEEVVVAQPEKTSLVPHTSKTTTPPAGSKDDKEYRNATMMRFPYGALKGKTLLECVLNDRPFMLNVIKNLEKGGRNAPLVDAINLVLQRNPE